ncbi:MAG: AAA family ATPase [bacterium]|nr:AAA family ATPase [bacterium]
MIERIKLKNFRSIQGLDLELKSLNVLIGRNGSGKSNFLSFFHLLGEGARGRLNRTIVNELRGFEFLRFLNADTWENISWDVTFSSDPVSSRYEPLFYEGELSPRGVAGYNIQSEIISRPPYPDKHHLGPYKYLEVRDGTVTKLKARPNEDSESREDEVAKFEGLDQELAVAEIRNPTRYPSIDEVYRRLREWTVFRGFGERELSQVRGPQTLNVVNPLQLDPDGSNLVSILYELTNQPQYEEIYNRLNEIIQAVFEDFSKFDLPLVAGAQASLSFRSRNFKKSIPALFMSDGQLRFLGLIVLLLLPSPPKLLLIDEPEIGMHPKMITIFAEVLKSAAQRTQIIVSTHSPQLIDALSPDDLLVVDRENGATVINRPDQERLARWLERYSTGYLWTNTTLLER